MDGRLTRKKAKIHSSCSHTANIRFTNNEIRNINRDRKNTTKVEINMVKLISSIGVNVPLPHSIKNISNLYLSALFQLYVI